MCDWPFIWKHFANDKRMERFYGCVDVEVLHWIEEKIEKVMKGMKVENDMEINMESPC